MSDLERPIRGLCAAVLLAAAASAQTFVGGAGGGGAFTWADEPHLLGPVRLPAAPLAPLAGWYAAPGGILLRLVPSLSGDPTIEVLLQPPASGNASLPERFLLQFPLGLPAAERALVIGFHPYGVSEKSVFVGTSLPALCAQRGWLLVAAYGLVDTSFANVPSQESLEAVLALVRAHFAFDETRVYAVGFSMGGLGALSYAMRHRDPHELRPAALVLHTPPVDARREYTLGSPLLKSILADPLHFGGSPDEVPFAYERVSPLGLGPGGVPDPARAPLSNVVHVPIYLHVNLDDPFADLVLQAQALYGYLAQRGASVTVDAVRAGPQHAWGTLAMGAAVRFLARHRLTADPPLVELFADRAAAYGAADFRALAGGQHARARVAADALHNAAVVDETRALDALALDVAALGLDPTEPLELTAGAADATGDELVLSGYPAPPSEVLADGVPFDDWSFDADAAELTLATRPDGAAVQLRVLP